MRSHVELSFRRPLVKNYFHSDESLLKPFLCSAIWVNIGLIGHYYTDQSLQKDLPWGTLSLFKDCQTLGLRQIVLISWILICWWYWHQHSILPLIGENSNVSFSVVFSYILVAPWITVVNLVIRCGNLIWGHMHVIWDHTTGTTQGPFQHYNWTMSKDVEWH